MLLSTSFFLKWSLLCITTRNSHTFSSEALKFPFGPKRTGGITASDDSDKKTECDHGSLLLFDQLENEVLSLFEGMTNYGIAMKKDGGNIEIRTTTFGTNVFSFGEAKRVPTMPEKFKGFLENFANEFGKVNSMVESTAVVERDPENKREGVKSIIKFPFPLTDRIMIHWKYLHTNRNPDEHMLFLSNKDNQGLLDRWFTSQDQQKYVLGHTLLCAYWIRPIYEQGEVVGSNVLYLYNGDTGGKVPKKLQNFVGTQAAYDSVKGLLQFVRKEDQKVQK